MKLPKSSIQFKFAPALLIIFTLGSFAICQSVQAVVPPPDGGYPGFNTAEGTNALMNLTTGAGNAAVGWYSLFSNTDGSFNTGVGAGTLALNTGGNNTAVGGAALLSNTTGNDNTAVGVTALVSNTTGYLNTATGVNALSGNTVGVGNNAFGWGALLSNTTGTNNNAFGVRALQNNTEGSANVAVGEQALLSNTTGAANTAVGYQALSGNNGDTNTAIGFAALLNNNTGHDNTAVAYNALFSNTIGSFNTAIGVEALSSNNGGAANTAIGYRALKNNTTGNANIAVGLDALSDNTTGVNNIGLGNNAGAAVNTASGVTCLNHSGANVSDTTWIWGVYGVTTQSGTAAPVIVSDHGQLGTLASSRRFKKDITTMDRTSEAVLSLRPVTFHYKTDDKGTPQFGLIAEEVVKVNPALVLPDKEGKPYTVRYEAVNAMLLNEFLKEHLTVQEQGRELRRQAATIAKQQKQIQVLTSGLQKISAEVQMGRPAPQVVLNKP